ncbi:MAG: hypothetical protein EOP00_03230 [Pedobacter sp.]|nr:MAG: hypothetical protein EOP00_03230 [Pedobacter sp.]
MKYHYQYVSKTTVRIELIAEDKNETAKLEKFGKIANDHPEIINYYIKGLQAYHPGAELTKTNFMSFPKVALCSFKLAHELIVEVA